MAKCFVINGKGSSGKDSFVNFCKDYAAATNDKYILNVSSVDQVKDIATKYFYWDGKKDLKSRKMLSDIKDFHTKMVDGPFLYMKQYVHRYFMSDKIIIFFHIREPREIERFVKESCAKTILIRRPGLEAPMMNHADDNVETMDYDFKIDNDGSLEEFRKKAKQFFEQYCL